MSKKRFPIWFRCLVIFVGIPVYIFGVVMLSIYVYNMYVAPVYEFIEGLF
jgi:hypothetical protein